MLEEVLLPFPASSPLSHYMLTYEGMRSNSMSWLFNTACVSSITLPGGYKAFRQWVLHILSIPRSFIVLGGMTGTGNLPFFLLIINILKGKTRILQELSVHGEQVIDLEHFANHKGTYSAKNAIFFFLFSFNSIYLS